MKYDAQKVNWPPISVYFKSVKPFLIIFVFALFNTYTFFSCLDQIFLFLIETGGGWFPLLKFW